MQHILSRFAHVRSAGGNGTAWSARCPAHDDEHNSLSIRLADSGKVLLKCHAGCSFAAVAAAVHCTTNDFDLKPGLPIDDRIAATYDYRDEQGVLLYQVVRFRPKGFRQRRPVAGGWAWGLGPTRRVLYRLPELSKSADRLVLVVEGEKDADRLASLGFLATTCAMGAGKWTRASTQYNDALRGRRVVILPDNDAPGREHARLVSAALAGIAASVHVLELAGLGDKGDVSDWLDAGHTADELQRLLDQLLQTAPAAAATVTPAPSTSVAAAAAPAESLDVDGSEYVIGLICELARALDERSLLELMRELLAGSGE